MAETACLRNAYGNILLKLGAENDKIVVLDADLAKSTQTIKFASQFKDRFIDIGLSEQDMISIAAGISLTGKTVFASSFCVFLAGRVFDQVRQSVCYNNADVKLVATHSGLGVGEDGATHQALEDIALMRALPNMKVIVPADAMETEKAVVYAAENYGPFFIRLVRSPLPLIYDNGYRFQLGKASVLKDGSDIALFGCGAMVHKALEAEKILSEKGISAAVINLSTIKPLDEQTILEYAQKCKKLVSIEDHSIHGGMGSAICELLAQKFPVKVALMGMKDQFGRSGKPEELYKYFSLTAKDISDRALELLE